MPRGTGNPIQTLRGQGKVKEVVYILEVRFHADAPEAAAEIAEAIERLQQYGSCEIADVEVITRDMDQIEMRQ
jgi:hypothetical protein